MYKIVLILQSVGVWDNRTVWRKVHLESESTHVRFHLLMSPRALSQSSELYSFLSIHQHLQLQAEPPGSFAKQHPHFGLCLCSTFAAAIPYPVERKRTWIAASFSDSRSSLME